MKITRIEAIPVNVPYLGTATMSGGAIAHSTRTIVSVETDAGLSGLGEATYGPPAQIIARHFAPALVGLDPLDRDHLRRHCLPTTLDYGTPLLKLHLAAWAGVETALWDIAGKAAGVPLYRLLGGPVRDRARFVAYAYADPDPARVVDSMAARAVRQTRETGSDVFEFKIGAHPVVTDIETVRAVAAALGGSARVAVDANMGMTVDDARRFLAAVGKLLENVEEPVPGLAPMAALADEFGVAVSTHCTDMETMGHYPGISGIVPTLDAAGGIAAVRRLARWGVQHGRRVWLRSHAEAGIGWAAAVHLGMALPELERPAQSLIDLIAEDLVLGEPWLVRQGGVVPPELPGLGVEADWPAIRHCHDLYQRLGDQLACRPDLDSAALTPLR